jgi:hypothetical protein
MREFGEQLMPQPDDNLDFSHKDEQPHTIEESQPEPLPFSLQNWLVHILRRMLSPKAPTSVEENEDTDKADN